MVFLVHDLRTCGPLHWKRDNYEVTGNSSGLLEYGSLQRPCGSLGQVRKETSVVKASIANSE